MRLALAVAFIGFLAAGCDEPPHASPVVYYNPDPNWRPKSAVPLEQSKVKAGVPGLPPGYMLDDDAPVKERDNTEKKGSPRRVFRLPTLVAFDAEAAPDPNDFASLKLSAERGDPNAQYRLALYHSYQTGGMTEMVKWLRAAALQNHVKAQTALGCCCEYGFGVPEDAAEAVTWYRRAGDLGHPHAQYELGRVYYAGKGVQQDYAEAVKWYTKAAEQGYAVAQHNLGWMYANGQGVRQDYAEAVKWFTKAAEQGAARAQFNLGVMYSDGQGVPHQDYREAAKWYTKAAEQGNAEAQYNLGVMYAKGEGVPQDDKEAAKWYTKAAEQGDAEAQYNLGRRMYYEGKGVTQDYKEAAKWLTKAAEQGNASAQFDLGGMYLRGEGVQQNYAEAVKWLTKAAERGNTLAQAALGEMYFQGQEIPQDYKEAAKWYTKAAEQGLAEAQFNLSLKFYKGQGVLEDYTEAYKWALLAGMNGVDRAQNLKDTLRREMKPGQIAEAQQRAKGFLDQREGKPPEDGQGQTHVTATATGFLITANGYVLTAQHAIEKVGRIEVLYQQRRYPAKVIVNDEAIDVAVLRIEGTGFPCLPLVSSATVKTGDAVFTMGFPQVALQGAEPKFTEGSISSLSGPAGSSRFFQISAPVQPGNSGGPLVDERGQVVGMVNARLNDLTTLAASGMLPQNVNYAVKSSFILPFLEGIEGLSVRAKAQEQAATERSALIERTKKALVMVVCY
jgi:TPR repeat protein